MSGHDEWKPIERFWHACLLVLFGMIALSVAVELLSQIWQWLVGAALGVGLLAIGIAIWRARSRPW